MIGYQYDDGGRKAAGRRSKGDCVARAIALITQRPYEECYKRLANAQKDAGFARSANNGVSKKVSRRIFEEAGLVKVKQGRGPKLTLGEAYARYGNCIVSTRRHVIALIDGAVHDTWDSRFTHKPVRGWTTGEYFICEDCAIKAAVNEGWIAADVCSSEEAGLIVKRIHKPGSIDAQLLCPECYWKKEPGRSAMQMGGSGRTQGNDDLDSGRKRSSRP